MKIRIKRNLGVLIIAVGVLWGCGGEPENSTKIKEKAEIPVESADPMPLPDPFFREEHDKWTEVSEGYDSLSYPKNWKANYLSGKTSYPPENLFDGQDTTWWTPESPRSGRGATLTMVLKGPAVGMVIGNLSEREHPEYGNLYRKNNRIKRAKFTCFSGYGDQAEYWFRMEDRPGLHFIPFPDGGLDCAKIELTIEEVYKGEEWNDLAVAEIGFVPHPETYEVAGYLREKYTSQRMDTLFWKELAQEPERPAPGELYVEWELLRYAASREGKGDRSPEPQDKYYKDDLYLDHTGGITLRLNSGWDTLKEVWLSEEDLAIATDMMEFRVMSYATTNHGDNVALTVEYSIRDGDAAELNCSYLFDRKGRFAEVVPTTFYGTCGGFQGDRYFWCGGRFFDLENWKEIPIIPEEYNLVFMAGEQVADDLVALAYDGKLGAILRLVNTTSLETVREIFCNCYMWELGNSVNYFKEEGTGNYVFTDYDEKIKYIVNSQDYTVKEEAIAHGQY